MKWQVRIFIIAIAASLTVILHGFISLKPSTGCALNKHTNIQYRFIHQTLSPGIAYQTLSTGPEISSEDGGTSQPMNAFLSSSEDGGTSQQINAFLSPYHKYHPVNCTALFTGSSLDKWFIHHKLVHKRNVNNGSFDVPSDAEVCNIFHNLLLELKL